MNQPRLILFLPQTLLSACAVVLALWLKLPWAAIVSLGILTLAIMSASHRQQSSKWNTALIWACTAVLAGSLLVPGKIPLDDAGYAVLGLLNAAALVLAGLRFVDRAAGTWWKALGMTWAMVVVSAWLKFSYEHNLSIAFHLGLLLGVVLLVLCRILFRLPAPGILLVHTLILLFVGLPLGDYLVRPSSRADAHPALWRRYYLFENAKNNPRGYNAWQLAYVARCGNLWRHIFMNGDATTTPPWRLRPGSSCPLFESRIVINQRGFRGPEIPADKGDAYRIVALGESTTFGLTIFADEKPWPELLEQMIRQRLKLRRPVQVINAGVPSYTLKMNLDRMARDVLPLKPDMILSYHGINGFVLMQDKGASAFANNPPEYRPRPLKLLADAEYRWKMFRFGRQARQAEWDPPAPSELVNTEYGRAYEELIRTAQTNGIRLVVANFSMAVNARSSRELQEFYRPLYPAVHWDIRANELHSVIVEQIARRHPEVGFVETRPKLDGEHDKFLDLVHFAPEGEQQMAETFFAGIRSILEKDIGCMEPQELAATRQAVIDTVPRPMSF